MSFPKSTHHTDRTHIGLLGHIARKVVHKDHIIPVHKYARFSISAKGGLLLERALFEPLHCAFGRHYVRHLHKLVDVDIDSHWKEEINMTTQKEKKTYLCWQMPA